MNECKAPPSCEVCVAYTVCNGDVYNLADCIRVQSSLRTFVHNRIYHFRGHFNIPDEFSGMDFDEMCDVVFNDPSMERYVKEDTWTSTERNVQNLD